MAVIYADERVAKARDAIKEILAALERETGQLVENLSITRFDVTRIEDTSTRHLMDIRIEMYRVPGHDW